ncbi:MAG: peptidase [Roseiflexus castenholzii]|uniref:S9 family peptidase n=1 Tax=Roseiflexus castenholzii TaxID=120962 RepID=UPI000CB242D3|nr:MAG: peptidase [Roseiflexus castenholzii]
MTHPQIAPYGSWRSPITAALVATSGISLGTIALDGDNIYWLEGRPAEGGRVVVVRRTADGAIADVTPQGFNVRTRVHEYGGAPYTVDQGMVYFSNFADQRLYCQRPGAAPEPITPETLWRYADFEVDRRRNRLIGVREDHSGSGEAVNTIVAISLDGAAEQRVLVSGADFYANPRLSPDGQWLAWLSWNHPNMPWDAAELWVAPVREDGMPGAAERIAGGPDDAAFQPAWGPDGALFFVAERTGWWNLYRWHNGVVHALCPMEAECGLPLWVFGARTYAVESADRLVCTYIERGEHKMALLDARNGNLTPLDLPFSDFGFTGPRATGGRVVFVGASPAAPAALVMLDLASGALTTVRRSMEMQIDPGFISTPQVIEFPTEGGVTAFGFYYPPRNRDFLAPEGEKPPLLVLSHGGPTGATSASFDPGIQFWTSRGIAVMDVNYGGSTGFGRAYRQRLDGRWGIVDVDDCCNAAMYLVAQGLADPERQIIAGGSAGGYTTLAALTFRHVFKVGASFYGVSDLEALARDTHKFESRYLDRLVGPYPERVDIYHARSPIYHIERLNCPVIFLQGLEDKVVPPDQSERMAAALRTKGIPVAYLAFEGEQHGFRKAETIIRALEAELYFYARILGFELADPVAPIVIDNL